jgi:hypothetical protein
MAGRVAGDDDRESEGRAIIKMVFIVIPAILTTTIITRWPEAGRRGARRVGKSSQRVPSSSRVLACVKQVPVLQCHGDQDGVVRFSWGKGR